MHGVEAAFTELLPLWNNFLSRPLLFLFFCVFVSFHPYPYDSMTYCLAIRFDGDITCLSHWTLYFSSSGKMLNFMAHPHTDTHTHTYSIYIYCIYTVYIYICKISDDLSGCPLQQEQEHLLNSRSEGHSLRDCRRQQKEPNSDGLQPKSAGPHPSSDAHGNTASRMLALPLIGEPMLLEWSNLVRD